jgi:hypothetical protein
MILQPMASAEPVARTAPIRKNADVDQAFTERIMGLLSASTTQQGEMEK